MPEILFIAIDPCILALVENLQELVEPRVWLESDYTSGIKRIFDTQPAIVFLQHKIGAVTCDKLANQVKMLLEGSPVPMVLLSDESVMSYSVVSTYEACFDICLPLQELSLQVQQLLRTLPQISWKEPVQPPPAAAPFETTMELSLPAGAADLFAFPWQEAAAEIGAQFPPLSGATLEAFETNEVSSDRLEIPAEQEPQFLSDFLEDRFVISPLPVSFGETNRQNAAASYPTAPQQESRSDLRRLEREDPRLVFEGLPEPPQEPSIPAPKPIGPKPIGPRPVGNRPTGKKAAAAQSGPANRTQVDNKVSLATTQQQASPAESPLQRATFPLADELPESVAASLGIRKDRPRYFRGAVFGMLLVICIAALDLLVTLHRSAGPGSSQGIDSENKLQAPRGASRPATPQLPQFIPQVAPDPDYPASHPGWERYQADGLEYLVYREKGSVAAVQVLSQQPGALSPPFLKTCIRLSAGAERFTIKKTEERNGMQISTGTLQNGGELAVYKTVPGGEIRGFVLTFPSSAQASAQDAKK